MDMRAAPHYYYQLDERKFKVIQGNVQTGGGVGWLIGSLTPFGGLRFEQIWHHHQSHSLLYRFCNLLPLSPPPSQSCCFPTTALFPPFIGKGHNS